MGMEACSFFSHKLFDGVHKDTDTVGVTARNRKLLPSVFVLYGWSSMCCSGVTVSDLLSFKNEDCRGSRMVSWIILGRVFSAG